MPHLKTARLRMVPFTVELVHAALRDRAALSAMLAAHVPDEWPGPDFAEMLQFEAERLAQNPERGQWGGVIIHQAERTVVGDMGFKGGPDQAGALEIGYSIIPAYRGRGFAPEMAWALIAWGLAQPGVQRVTAECAADNLASVRVLEKLGMRRLNPKDGMLWWELRKL